MTTRFISMFLIVLTATLMGCATINEAEQKGSNVTAKENTQELVPGMLQGYLTKEEQLDSKEFVLPSPSENSAQQLMDNAWADKMQGLRGTARWNIAITDADLSFPNAANVFSCALGIPINESETPELYNLLRRTLTDVGLASYSAKNAYQRERPFMVRGGAICTPQDEDALRKDGSYPSGHTSIGWGWALILTELVPARTEAILARGRSYGENRNVCNVHWYSDVVAGRLVGAGAVAKLHSDDEFLVAMEDARKEIERVRAQGLAPKVDCDAEEAALATVL